MNRLECEQIVLREHDEHVGKTILVSVLTAYLGGTDDQGDFVFDPPIRCCVDQTDDASVLHRLADWIDPYWDVTILDEQHPQMPAKGLRSAWVFGPSINLKTGQREPSTEWRLDASLTPEPVC